MPTARHDPGGNPDNDNDNDNNNDNADRAFRQALLSRQTLTFETVQPLIARIETAAHPQRRPVQAADVSQRDVDAYLQRANAVLSPYDFEIRRAQHQVTRQLVYALVNTTSDALTQLATLRTADELAFVKRVLDAMFHTYNARAAEVMAVSSMQALRLARVPGGGGGAQSTQAGSEPATQATQAAAGLTMTQAEKVLDGMVVEGWFEKSARGFYSLAPRALMELRGWLIDTYNDSTDDDDDEDEDEDEVTSKRIKTCAACRDIVTVGRRCPDLACPARLHDHCVDLIFRARGGREECPVCSTAWLDAPAVGEQASRGDNSRVTAVPRRNGKATAARRDESIMIDEDEVDVEDGVESSGDEDEVSG